MKCSNWVGLRNSISTQIHSVPNWHWIRWAIMCALLGSNSRYTAKLKAVITAESQCKRTIARKYNVLLYTCSGAQVSCFQQLTEVKPQTSYIYAFCNTVQL